MRIARWLIGILAGLVLLCVAAVIVVTLFVDPNRFKGRIERIVQGATGQPFSIRGDLDISWYPWLALQMGPAQLGADPPLAQWQSARVGAKLIPLLQGRLIVGKIRLDGLQLHLQRFADGRSNWDSLLAAGPGSKSNGLPPQIAGLEIRNGSVEYVDAQSGMRLALAQWQLDVKEWAPARPLVARTRFKLASGAQVDLSFDLDSLQPLRATGALSVATTSLRQLLADLAVGGPRPRDLSVLGAFQMSAPWAISAGAIAVKPIQMQLDQTRFSGELARASNADPVVSFKLRGDRITLHRYTELDDTDSVSFELPTAALQALRVQGVLSFAEVELADARMKNVQLRVELKDGELNER